MDNYFKVRSDQSTSLYCLKGFRYVVFHKNQRPSRNILDLAFDNKEPGRTSSRLFSRVKMIHNRVCFLLPYLILSPKPVTVSDIWHLLSCVVPRDVES